MSHVVVGIDPGVTGAMACLVDGELFEVEDMPTFVEQRGRRKASTINAAEVCLILERFALQNGGRPSVVIERVHSTPQMGVASAFSFGDSFGVVRAVPLALGCPTTFVEPRAWKADMSLSADKELSRRRASERWPSRASEFARAKDDGRAEAALLALWGWERMR